MSNKSKYFKRLIPYEKTAGELRHEGLVHEAILMRNRFGGSKHVGSKPERILMQHCVKYLN